MTGPMELGPVDPLILSALLTRAGWREVGGRAGEYSRFTTGDDFPTNLVIPLNPNNADYTDLLTDAVRTLQRLSTTQPSFVTNVLDQLSGPPGDEIQFRKAAATIRGGAISWPQGEGAFASAKELLLAGAKTRMSRRAYFGQSHGQFARRFLEAVLMGQTQVGSYVVTAFAPPDQTFPDQVKKDGTESLIGYSGREIVETLATAIASTRDAIDHYQSSNSMSGFLDGVRTGVSRELTEGLRKLVRDSGESSITIAWANAPSVSPVTFEFSGASEPVLARAATELATTEPAQFVTATGWPSVLSRPRPGEAGVIRLKVRRGSSARTLQVRVSEEQFDIAATAISHDRLLTVSGRQEKDGNRHWLYDATDLAFATVETKSTTPDVPPGGLPMIASNDDPNLFD